MSWGDPLLDYFFWIQIVGGACLTVLIASSLCAARSDGRSVNPVPIAFYTSFLLNATPGILLLYYAGQVVGPAPSPDVCLASAVFSSILAPFNAAATFALTFEVWHHVQYATRPEARLRPYNRRISIVLTIFPAFYATVLAMVWLAYGLKHREKVLRAKFYCTIEVSTATVVYSVSTFIMIFPAFVFSAWVVGIVIMTYVPGQRQRRGQLDIPFIIRSMIFVGYVLAAVIISLVDLQDWTNVRFDLFSATFPLAVSLLFGGHKALIALRGRLSGIPLLGGRVGPRTQQPTLSKMPSLNLETIDREECPSAAGRALFPIAGSVEYQDKRRSSSPGSSARSLSDEERGPCLPPRPHFPGTEGCPSDLVLLQAGSLYGRTSQVIYRQGFEVNGSDMTQVVLIRGQNCGNEKEEIVD
ncbi:hypothetical protein OE88DRAFT_1739965 [Heliocybe sulcata]|uniref:G-protein coupled receptors family 1 profile domain-containing protein n=1 Tax=Heliocybe sulcata TaxID=5364 RepID=A0A5C3MM89_9AGAM|nr:hypothetical protein OE88DRAFT_1739965 [Heliocybe sulcata]